MKKSNFALCTGGALSSLMTLQMGSAMLGGLFGLVIAACLVYESPYRCRHCNAGLLVCDCEKENPNV